MSILTEGKGLALKPMIDGMIKRYQDAEVFPPKALYVHRDCCGYASLLKYFGAWPQLNDRLGRGRHTGNIISGGSHTRNRASGGSHIETEPREEATLETGPLLRPEGATLKTGPRLYQEGATLKTEPRLYQEEDTFETEPRFDPEVPTEHISMDKNNNTGNMDTEFPAAFDSHFYMDRTSVHLWRTYDDRTTPEDIINHILPMKLAIPVNLYGGVAVYSEPVNWPKQIDLHRPWYAAVGVHPKHVKELTEAKFRDLSSHLRTPCVSALGEIGLDHSVCSKLWRQQEDVFLKVLSLAVVSHPIILHLRGTFSGNYGLGVTSRCIQLLHKGNISPEKIRSCTLFCWDPTMVSELLKEFSNIHFGFTSLVSTFCKEQKEGLRSIPEDRILLETDSPYFAPKENKTNTPAFRGNVAELMARHLGITAMDLLSLTLRNEQKLYGP